MTDTPPPPRPSLATCHLALQEAIGTLTAAINDGEVPNPILGEAVRLDLIRNEAVIRRQLEKP